MPHILLDGHLRKRALPLVRKFRLGADLRAVGARLGRKDLLETILAPSKVIDDKYRDVSFELKSGRQLTGRLIGGDDVSLLISPNVHLPFDAITIRPEEVESQKVCERLSEKSEATSWSAPA